MSANEKDQSAASQGAAPPPDNGGRIEGPHLIAYRDPADVRTIFQLLTALLALAALLAASGLGNAYLYWRRPDRIVVDRSGGRVLTINDRQFGETPAASISPDRLTDEDKKYAVGEFLAALYAIDPARRAAQLKAALEMMVPQSAAKFAAYLKEQRVVERQRVESWQSVWTPQDVSIDQRDPYTLRVIGRQEITRVVNHQAVSEAKQLQLVVKLVADPAGRTDLNRRTGFLVASIDYKEIGPENRTEDK